MRGYRPRCKHPGRLHPKHCTMNLSELVACGSLFRVSACRRRRSLPIRALTRLHYHAYAKHTNTRAENWGMSGMEVLRRIVSNITVRGCRLCPVARNWPRHSLQTCYTVTLCHHKLEALRNFAGRRKGTDSADSRRCGEVSRHII
jgi:hypothetical protein